jgi:type I restriction enzyme S subunit
VSAVVNAGYKQTEVGVIPEEWDAISIGTLATFTSGGGISVAELSGSSTDTPVPVFGGNGIAGYTSRALVSEPVVIVGRVGQKCGEVYLSDGPAWITDNALYPRIIRPNLDVRFLAMALKAAGLNNVKNRNDLPLVTQSILHAVRIPWPPGLPEQRAIAEALSDVDALLGALDRLIAKKRDLKQAAMQQLLTGQTRLPGFHGEWEVKRFGEVAHPRRERVDPRTAGVQDFCIELEHIASASGELFGSTNTCDQSSLKSVFPPATYFSESFAPTSASTG